MEEFLRDIAQDKIFYFRNGNKARNLYELAQHINSLNDDEFKFHCNPDHDDFANWIGGALGDIVLSRKLRRVKDKSIYLKILNRRLKILEKKSHNSQLNKQFAEQFRNLLKDYGHVWLIIFIMIITSIFTAMIYFQYHSLQTIRTLDEKINYIESRNTCFNNYFNEQILKTRDVLNEYNLSLDNYCVFNYSTTLKIPDESLENRPAIIPISSIIIEDNQIIIRLDNASLSLFTNTSSMLPILNHNTKAIEIKPKEEDLHVGDIISFKDNEDIIVHRIIDIGSDDRGTYYITKGDNNNAVDQNKVRFEDIKGKVVILIY
jgi:signal peptidase I